MSCHQLGMRTTMKSEQHPNIPRVLQPQKLAFLLPGGFLKYLILPLHCLSSSAQLQTGDHPKLKGTDGISLLEL